MSIEVGNGIATGCSIVDDRETAEKLKVCEKKLVDESETMNSRYSPLCRQVGVCVCVCMYCGES